jgi:hypothetical protein
MQITNPFKSFSTIEVSLLIVFILYIVFPIKTPAFLTNKIDTPVGLLVIFAVTAYLFFYSNPILAILYIFVAYELLRRSYQFTGNTMIIQPTTPSQASKDYELQKMNPPQAETLEEEVVQSMAPIGKSDVSEYLSSSYKPVAEKLAGASLF